jgi:hypothetical protein
MAGKAEKRNSQCKNRAESRFVPGKSIERLSPYYRLSCDAGTSLINTWGIDENTEPLYFCEAHANEFKSSAAFRRGAESTARRNKRIEHAGQREPQDQEPAVSPALVAVILGRTLSTPIAANSAPVPQPMRSASVSSAEDRAEARTGDRAEARTGDRSGDRAEARRGDRSEERTEHRAEARTEQPSGERTEERCETIERQIQELVSQMESILSQSDAAIDVAIAIDAPIEETILKLIDDTAMSDMEKDAAMARLGELQKGLKSGIGERMRLPEAYRLKRNLEACLGANLAIPHELTLAYRALHSSMEKAIRSALLETAGDLVGTS